MNPEHLRDFAALLRRHHLKFVVVGGAAVRHFYPSESQDVDPLLLARDYSASLASIDRDPSVVSFSSEAGEMATGHFHSRFRLVRFDLLNPGAFSGTRSGDAFFDYVHRYGSVPTPDGRLAKVPVVWYTRLVFEGGGWTAHVGKILRDVRAGAPWSLRSGVRRIAREFGTLSRIDDRWRLVEECARRAGLLPDRGRGA